MNNKLKLLRSVSSNYDTTSAIFVVSVYCGLAINPCLFTPVMDGSAANIWEDVPCCMVFVKRRTRSNAKLDP